MTDALARYRQTEPRKDALKRYRQEPQADTLGALARYLGLDAYWDRQGRMAQDGLQMAEQGANSVRAGNFSGLGGALLGPVAYLSSPINALFPERSEVDAAGDVPDWSKPFIAGGLETAAAFLPGPKTRGLGKGMAQLADAATDAERAALGSRLEAEAAQTGGQASAVTRDQALRNLTEAPSWNPSALKDKYAAMSRDDLLTEAVKRGGVANPDKLSAPKLRQALFDMDVSDEQSRNMGKMVDRSLKNDPTSWQ